MAKLKNHATCGVTLSLKNCFGTLPASIYGDDSGRGRAQRESHDRARTAWATRASGSLRNRRRRSCISARITMRDIACRTLSPIWRRRGPFILRSSTAWKPSPAAKVRGSGNVRMVKPGVLLAGLNPVCTDAVATAAMGYSPRATRGTAPFQTCDNTLDCWRKRTAWGPPI